MSCPPIPWLGGRTTNDPASSDLAHLASIGSQSLRNASLASGDRSEKAVIFADVESHMLIIKVFLRRLLQKRNALYGRKADVS